MANYFETLRWAIGPGKTAAEARLLAALCIYSDRDGYCYPSRRRLAEDIYGEATPSRCRGITETLSRLEHRGLIHREDRRRPDGSQTSNGYRLMLDLEVRGTPPLVASAPGGSESGAPSPLGVTPPPKKQPGEGPEKRQHALEGETFPQTAPTSVAGNDHPGTALENLLDAFEEVLEDTHPTIRPAFQRRHANKKFGQALSRHGIQRCLDGLEVFSLTRGLRAADQNDPLRWLVGVFPLWLDDPSPPENEWSLYLAHADDDDFEPMETEIAPQAAAHASRRTTSLSQLNQRYGLAISEDLVEEYGIEAVASSVEHLNAEWQSDSGAPDTFNTYFGRGRRLARLLEHDAAHAEL